MADEHKTRSELVTALATNTTNAINSQAHRNQLLSSEMRNVTEIAFADSPYTATDNDATILADATGGAITINLPAVAGVTHRKHVVKKTDVSVNAVTVDASSTELIDGAETYILDDQYDTVEIQAGSAKWHILSKIAAD